MLMCAAYWRLHLLQAGDRQTQPTGVATGAMHCNISSEWLRMHCTVAGHLHLARKRNRFLLVQHVVGWCGRAVRCHFCCHFYRHDVASPAAQRQQDNQQRYEQ